MEKSSHSPVFVLSEPQKPSFLQRAIGYVGMIGGGLLGGHYGLKAYGGHAAPVDIDITKPGSWEAHLVDEVPLAAQRETSGIVDAALSKASGVPINRIESAQNDANSFLERMMQEGNPNAKLAAVEGPKRRLDINPEGIVDTPYTDHPAPKPSGGQPAPRVISAKSAKRLMELACVNTEEVTGIEAISYHHSAEGMLSAKLHIGDGHIHIPEIDPVHLGLGSNFLPRGASRYVSNPHEVAMGALQIIPNALGRRQQALLAETGGGVKATWGALRKLDGMGKFNVAGTALMGVILGGFVADIAKSVVGGISHLGTATPREPGKRI